MSPTCTSIPSDGQWKYRTDTCSNDIRDFSLVFVLDHEKSRILLGMKKRGFGQGLRYNGYGGKPETGEDMVHCAQRELEEESGITCHPSDLHHIGKILIARPAAIAASQSNLIAIHVFTLTKSDAEAFETEEMSPRWYRTPDGIPYDHMWPEARLYLPGIFQVAGVLQAYIEYRCLPDDFRGETWRQIVSSVKGYIICILTVVSLKLTHRKGHPFYAYKLMLRCGNWLRSLAFDRFQGTDDQLEGP